MTGTNDTTHAHLWPLLRKWQEELRIARTEQSAIAYTYLNELAVSAGPSYGDPIRHRLVKNHPLVTSACVILLREALVEPRLHVVPGLSSGTVQLWQVFNPYRATFSDPKPTEGEAVLDALEKAR